MIIIGIILVIILFWAIKSGQFDDLEGDAHRILMDEELTPQEKPVAQEKTTEGSSLKEAEGSLLKTAEGSTSEEQEMKNMPVQADKSKESS
jgi:cbb3-type cytochrome oxidase maturation protein